MKVVDMSPKSELFEERAKCSGRGRAGPVCKAGLHRLSLRGPHADLRNDFRAGAAQGDGGLPVGRQATRGVPQHRPPGVLDYRWEGGVPGPERRLCGAG